MIRKVGRPLACLLTVLCGPPYLLPAAAQPPVTTVPACIRAATHRAGLRCSPVADARQAPSSCLVRRGAPPLSARRGVPPRAAGTAAGPGRCGNRPNGPRRTGRRRLAWRRQTPRPSGQPNGPRRTGRRRGPNRRTRPSRRRSSKRWWSSAPGRGRGRSPIRRRRSTPSPPPISSDRATANLANQLRAILPSFNVNPQEDGDTAAVVRPAHLRALAPHHTLLLVNGKRRHRGAVIAWNDAYGMQEGAQGRTSRPSRRSRCARSRSCATAPRRSTARTRSPA